MIDKKAFWNEAGKTGLYLGAVPIIYLGYGSLTNLIGPDRTGIALIAKAFSLLLWIGKLLLCIYIMRNAMLKFYSNHKDADNSNVFSFGCAAAALSALLFSAFYLAYMLFIAPDTFSTVMEMMAENPMMDSNTMDQLESMMPKMPAIAFFANFFYCTLYGVILSAILSRNIPPQNPFQSNEDSQ